MSTLTYDPTPADNPEFSEEEQEAIKVGEALEEQQNGLLAGKFEDAEALEKAYIELQGKLGKPSEEQTEEVEEEKTEEDSTGLLDQLWEQATKNEFSDDTIAALRESSPDDLARMYLEYRNGVETEQRESEPTVLTEEQIDGLKNVVGGQENYDQMISWAGDNLADGDINMFDHVMDKGDPAACFFAIQALQYRFQEGTGYDGQMITGKPAVNKADVYRSQAELVAAQGDPRYENDPAYRNDVMEKLMRSPNLQF
tara:strand:+ start:260 stop:1024 length:765 start_codon:yes stop_codon:yes gene_type:complete